MCPAKCLHKTPTSLYNTDRLSFSGHLVSNSLDGKVNLDSLRQLQISLARIDELIRAAVARAQAAGHDPTDSLRGLLISEDEIAHRLAQTPLAGLWPDGAAWPALSSISLEEDADLPFLRLIKAFDLTLLDSYILLLCLAPELDRRYERLYAYLQDDVSQRRPTVNLAANLLGNTAPERFAVWERLLPDRPLRTQHLIECAPDPSHYNPSFLADALKVDHRITAHLLGDALPDKRLKDAVTLPTGEVAFALPEAVITPIRAVLPEAPMIYLQGAEGRGQSETAARLCAEYNWPLISVDMARLAALDIPSDLAWRLALREASLAGGALLLDRWESCLDDKRQPSAELWTALLDYRQPVFLCGDEEWEPLDLYRVRRLLRIVLPIPAYATRKQAWEHFIGSEQAQVSAEEVDGLASKFRLTHTQIGRAVHTAVDLAQSRGEKVNAADLYAGAQAHASLRLGHLARRVVPRCGWDDLILPPDQLAQLGELTAWARYAHIVNDEWGFGAKIAHGRGVSALFAGESGTGKTLAAGVIANDLGLAMYRIDLSAVVSKYIGETEKNLGVIFREAHASNAILFFDEADALFGKRSEVKDARDRYANIEIAYLLQEIEDYDGIAILATNLRQNIDEAFTRRLDFLIDFPFPESEYRRQIWSAHFPVEAPLAPDVDLDQIAERYHLAGGNIRNVAIGAAYLAAADGGLITLAHIRRAIRREQQKMGRLLDDDL